MSFTESRYWNWKDNDSTFRLSQHLLGILQPGRYRGFDLDINNTSGWTVSIYNDETGINAVNIDLTTEYRGVYITPQGVVINVKGDKTFNLDPAPVAGLYRVDYLIAEHEYADGVTGGQNATYSIITGVADVAPIEPALPDPTRQIILAKFFITGGTTQFDAVGNTYTKQERPPLANFSEILDDISGILSDIADLQSRVSDLETLTATHTTQITNLQNDLADLIDDFNDLVTLVNSLQSTVSLHTSQISALQSNVATLNSNVAIIQGQIATLISDVSILQTNVLGGWQVTSAALGGGFSGSASLQYKQIGKVLFLNISIVGTTNAAPGNPTFSIPFTLSAGQARQIGYGVPTSGTTQTVEFQCPTTTSITLVNIGATATFAADTWTFSAMMVLMLP